MTLLGMVPDPLAAQDLLPSDVNAGALSAGEAPPPGQAPPPGPPLGKGMPPPPFTMAVPQDGFTFNVPLGAPFLSSATGLIQPLPPGTYGKMKPGDTLLGFPLQRKTFPMPSGFTHQGAELQAMGGSFGRARATLQTGKQIGDFSTYFAGSTIQDPNWRDNVYNYRNEFFGDLGYHSELGELHFSLTGVDKQNEGDPVPYDLLKADRAAAWTAPNSLTEKSLRGDLSFENDLSSGWTIQGNGYIGTIKQTKRLVLSSSVSGCPTDSAVLCDMGIPLLGSNGQQLSNFNSAAGSAGRYVYADRYDVDSTIAGASLQLDHEGELLGHNNFFSIAATLDTSNGTTEYTRQLGGVTTSDRVIQNWSGLPELYNINAETSANFFSLTVNNTTEVTDRLRFGLGGRFNYAAIDRSGTSSDPSQVGFVNDSQTFQRFNPAVGVIYEVMPDAIVYGSYSESQRFPTPIGTYCREIDGPCSLSIFLPVDQSLNDTVLRDYELGVRGQTPIGNAGVLAWNIGFFQRDSSDDAWLNQTIWRSMFRNIGETQRRGVRLGATYVGEPWKLGVEYLYQDARFQSSFSILSPDNVSSPSFPYIDIKPGDRLPNTPEHILRLSLDYQVNAKWTVGGSMEAATGFYVYGDEINKMGKSSPYVDFSLRTSYLITDNLELFGVVNNVFNTKYETGGTILSQSFLPSSEVAGGGSDARGYFPNDPRTFYVGLRARF
ncbi:TonB-dependent receptor [Sinorhizobium meliloti]|uniref:TonB-dependent receptor domain-containing protein n=1 Tax=Rhizobium meliloti TaxID=382 RepID=UPI003F156B98